MKRIGEVRRAQLVTTYGVGSVVAFNDKSYMVAGLDRWTISEPDLMEPRLARRLRVSGFVSPPAEGNRHDIPVVRFPVQHVCADCGLLQEVRSLLDEVRCRACQARLVPSRFVICCPRGHIDDFPYFKWVHAGRERIEGEKHTLFIDIKGVSASLQAIVVRCSCGEARTMHGAFAKTAIGRCTGRSPWIGGPAETCNETARTLQRGASNVWFSVVESSLSIPPWSDAVFSVLDRHWMVLKTLKDREILRNTLAQMPSVKASGFEIDDIVDVALQRQSGDNADDDGDLRFEEYQALSRGYPQKRTGDQFVCVPAKDCSAYIKRIFSRVMLATRLREVRALRSFTRLFPSAPGVKASDLPPIAADQRDWLPAIEVNGEGVFFVFEENRLAAWEVRADVRQRAAVINTRYLSRIGQMGASSTLVITPRLLLLHTFAHALINQWALDCGYPAASLRERLYISDHMAGILIYTATGDSAGSLGGVIGQASPLRLEPSIFEAIGRSGWCSADPVCIEADAQGTDSLNKAACHACVLLPEVSCEYGNVLLDRGMLVGWPEHQDAGFFSDLEG
jgi:hypothetical protein